jgi:hypothetical protein
MSYKGKDPPDPEHRPSVGSLRPLLCIFTFSIINKRQVPHSLSLQVYYIDDSMRKVCGEHQKNCGKRTVYNNIES